MAAAEAAIRLVVAADLSSWRVEDGGDVGSRMTGVMLVVASWSVTDLSWLVIESMVFLSDASLAIFSALT